MERNVLVCGGRGEAGVVGAEKDELDEQVSDI